MKRLRVLVIGPAGLETNLIANQLEMNCDFYCTTSNPKQPFRLSPSKIQQYHHLIYVETNFSKKDLALIEDLLRIKTFPVTVFTDNPDAYLLRRAIHLGVSAYVIDGLKGERINSVFQVSQARFEQIQLAQEQIETNKREIHARKRIDIAKAMLMNKRNMDEVNAYKTLRNMAMNQNKKISDVAENVIEIMKHI